MSRHSTCNAITARVSEPRYELRRTSRGNYEHVSRFFRGVVDFLVVSCRRRCRFAELLVCLAGPLVNVKCEFEIGCSESFDGDFAISLLV